MTEPSDPTGIPQQPAEQPIHQPIQQPVHQPVPMPPHSYSAQFGVGPVPLNNNLGWAIAGILVCWPFGIPALIKSLQVNSLWYQGQYDQAQISANEAKKWGKVAVIVGASLLGLYILAFVAYFVIMIAVFGIAATSG
ncbi:CD225/dispanin family protein [Saccharopolyspora sp. NPDC050389]|uniref:CD225/dispanin family protein n=1 Tax=Saccharopolyspora sp. NPDC050389 TaxID=3155516 RepID=UPI00340A6751